MPREVSPAQGSRYARAMGSVRKAILAMIVSSSALACGGTSSAPMDATADAFEGSSEGSVDLLTDAGDAGTEPEDGARDEADAPFLASCPACPATAPEAGAPCSSWGSDELDCEYGDDPRLVNVLVGCLAGQWVYS